MIKRVIDVDNYWKVIVYYNVDYNLFNFIAKDLYKIGTSKYQIEEIYNRMYNKRAKAVTISSIYDKTSVVLFNHHRNYDDYRNSIVHEAEHIKQSMLYYYNIEDKGEAPAYTVGYLAMKMLKMIV